MRRRTLPLLFETWFSTIHRTAHVLLNAYILLEAYLLPEAIEITLALGVLPKEGYSAVACDLEVLRGDAQSVSSIRSFNTP